MEWLKHSGGTWDLECDGSTVLSAGRRAEGPWGWKRLCCARRGWRGDQRLSGSASGDQTGDVAAGAVSALSPLTAQLHTPPTKPSIVVCSTNRLSGIFLCL